MYSSIHTALLDGIGTLPISVEVDISTGMPMFDMVGHLSAEVKEAKERVRTALHHVGIILPPKRVTINLSPGNVKKTGTGFDLPIAIALLVSLGLVDETLCRNRFFVGELSLNGRILPVRGILPMVSDAVSRGISECIVPLDNWQEATLVNNAKVYAFSDLKSLISFLNGEAYTCPDISIEETESAQASGPDFSDVNGQLYVKRACEIAAAGMHNLLMVGPPGAGKTMLSERMASILPPLTEEEKLEVSKIYSVCGLLKDAHRLISNRPFRSPHHTITKAGLAGGGSYPMPGEISLAHCGILFLDELPEFQKQTLEIMRQPLEEHRVYLTRVNGKVEYPSNFLLLAAMNPCNCGYYPDMQRCRCTPQSRKRYLEKISQPLIDRIDICVETPAVTYQELMDVRKNETSADIRGRVLKCHDIQCKRYQQEAFTHNSQIPAPLLRKYCALTPQDEQYLEKMYEKTALTGRSCHKILRVARTIADLDNSKSIQRPHLMEALCYRGIENKIWGGVGDEV